MDTQKIILVAAFIMTSLMLWQSWDAHLHPELYQKNNATAKTEPSSVADTPHLPENLTSTDINQQAIVKEKTETVSQLITVKTDVFELKIDTAGADIKHAQLLEYPIDVNYNKNPVVLFNTTDNRYFITQTGIVSRNINKNYVPDHTAMFNTPVESYEIGEKDKLEVKFTWMSQDGKLKLEKIYEFFRGKYEINVKQIITNLTDEVYSGYFYRQIQRNNPGQTSMLLYTYTGGMLYRDGGGFEKFSFEDMEDESLKKTIVGGWIAIIEHYFLASWIPDKDSTEHYYTRVIDSTNPKKYILGMTSSKFEIEKGQNFVQSDKLFIGPKLQSVLEKISPNLNDTVDFGFLSVIGHPIFWLLETIFNFVGNWGWSIVILTMIIKILFFKLSEYSYRSMAEMRKMGPKLKAIQEQHKDNPQAKNEAVMKMYRQEKINPLGGCLPVLVQIPVFIALYWVLLESVELRQADFILWLNNLSAPDPFYILPLVMGVTMFIQQKLNPAPADPVQAKVMMMLPIIFTVFFAFFPSGLVLYWVTNNVLSIAQQWYITRQIDKT